MEGGEATHLLRGASTTHRELLQAQATLSLMRRTGNQSTKFDFFRFAIQDWLPCPFYKFRICVCLQVGSAAAYHHAGLFFTKRYFVLLTAAVLVITWLNLR